ncbi:MAG: SIR2 family protein, partial [Gammaproteobacteria bacterium]|nr:SIR2 family protein [Gammaproteobacteria bacterium]
RGRSDWGLVQGVTQAEQVDGAWVRYFHAEGSPAEASEAQGWTTVLYHPLGCVVPAKNFLMSDSDLVEVLTEIDIQTPIPPVVQSLRTGRHFLFLGCRFNTQLDRIFARQIIKRSSDRHWAVLPDEPTRNEARFLKECNIQRLDVPAAEFAALLIQPRAARDQAKASAG